MFPYIETNPLSRFFKKHKDFFLKHKDKFWWLHSTYALLFGVGVMWLGKKNFNYIRLAILQIIFIWLTNLGMPLILSHPLLDLKWKHRIRLLINYFNRNIYQQILFFVIPIYYMSTTLDSQNVLFIILVVVSAVLSTMDIIYDRYISVKGTIMSLFFAFNLFVCINVMLPFLWNIKNAHAVRISGLFAFLGFASFCIRLANLKGLKKSLIIGAAAVLIFLITEFGRPFIPPAPMRIERTQFGKGVTKENFQVLSPLKYLPERNGKIYALNIIKAPAGYREKVRHNWYLNGKKIQSSRFFHIVGRGGRGFRFWTYITLGRIPEGSILRVDLESEDGQLIGRARLRSAAINGGVLFEKTTPPPPRKSF
jgi:hypothetical protein